MNTICEQATGQDDAQFWRVLSGRIAQERIPFYGTLSLTHRCNLRCMHCYIREPILKDAKKKPELNTEHWKWIIDEIREAGCLNLVLTGGEPLLRDDFPEIYSYAKTNGFLVNVFTNATLINKRILKLFRELPPRLVDISLYGATAETYERITGVPGSFRRAKEGIESLLNQETHIGLKSVLMTLNVDEFAQIEKMAQNYGVKFRRDAAIFPAFSGDRSPLDLRVAPEKVVEIEFADPATVEGWREFYGRYEKIPTLQSIYLCGAGLTTFHVDPYGILYPCTMVRSPSCSLMGKHFIECWNGEIVRLRDEKAPAGFRCTDCEKKLACGYCPGFFESENGRNDIPSDYLCAIGQLRYERIANPR